MKAAMMLLSGLTAVAAYDEEEIEHAAHEAAMGGRALYDVLKPKFLGAHDPVAVSFWIISIAMVAATVFFLMEMMKVGHHWKTSLTVGALVTLVAAVHYFYMREFWVTYFRSPIVYRYIDWTITVPLQMIEFYLILNAVGSPSSGMFYRLLVGTMVMLVAGYLGEAHMISPLIGFVVGMSGWAFILYEIFYGEGNQLAMGNVGKGLSDSTLYAYTTMRWIVSVGWSIYPLGYVFGCMLGGVDAVALNIIYNIADLLNKIGFCLAIWSAAVADSH